MSPAQKQRGPAWLTLASSTSSCDVCLAGGTPVQAAACQLVARQDRASSIVYVKSHGQPKSKKALLASGMRSSSVGL